MSLTSVCIIIGGWNLHSARGGDCSGRYSVQVSVLKHFHEDVFFFCLAFTLSDIILSVIVKWYLSRGRSSCGRAHRFRTVSQVDGRKHPKKSFGMQGTQGWPSCHTCPGQLRPITTTQGLGFMSLSISQALSCSSMLWLLSNLYVSNVRFSSTDRAWCWWVQRWILPSAGCLRLKSCCSFMPRPFTRASRLLCTLAM